MTTQSSHKQILKATGILGGAQVVEVLIRIARSKIIAVLLGPLGVGVIGLYQSTIELIQSTTGLGLDFSAVRDIAEAAGSGDGHRIARVIVILRRWMWFTGLLGMVLTLVFCKPLSDYAFGNEQYAWGIAVLSVVLLLNAVSKGRLALLQGIREVGMMAQAKVWGVLAGFCITVPLYWLLGIHGIVPAILITAIISFILSWIYSRKIPVQSIQIRSKEIFHGGLGMVRLGFFMVIAGFTTTASMYFVRALISQKSGIEGVGQFQAAWNLSSIYLAAVLQAMGTDYFPRLSAVNNDNAKVVQLVNEQTEVGLLVAGPLIVGMISFMSLVVAILYTAQFTETVRILHWQLAGTFLKVISWSLGFIILAKGRGMIFIFAELCWCTIYIGLIYLGWDAFGLEITGVAFLGSFVIYLVLLCVIAYKICGFRWWPESLKNIIVFGILIVFAFFTSKYMSGIKVYLTGGCLSLVAMGYSYYELRKIVDLKLVLRKFLRR